ncbi:MAG: EAL domain-containing protein [Arcobacteraceae bacterium]|nr:EAL domain-containing protein [Arcobacteraceae bacterium]
MKLKHIISTNVKIASKHDLISSLLSTMQENKISSIIVTDSKKHPIGIFTEFDAIKVVATGMNIDNLTAKDFLNSQELFVINEEIEIYKAFEIMQDKHCRHIIAVDDDKKIKGIATQSNFLKYLDTDVLIKLKTTADVMIKDVITMTPEYTLSDAAATMMHHRISCLVIVDDFNLPIGIITERDMVQYAKQSKNMVILKDVMSSPLRTVNTTDSLSFSVNLMEELKIRRLVVVNNDGSLAGIITRHDVLKSMQSKKIELLTHTLSQKNYELDIIKKQDEELKLLDIALRSSANAVVITDKDAIIRWCNSAFEELTGYKIKDILGKKPNHLTKSGIQTGEFYEILWSTILSKKSWKGEVVNKRRDGSLYNEKLSITPIIDSKGDITHFVAIKEDITQLKNMQKSIIESEMRFKNLFENAPLPYQSLDSKGIIVDVNRAWLEFSGYQYDEVIGSFIGSYLANEKEHLECSFGELLSNGEVKNKIFNFRTKNNSIRTIEVNGKISKDLNSGEKLTHCLLYDITEKQAMQDKIHYIAHHDILTNLPNKIVLNEHLDIAIKKANRNKTKIALIVLGLDRFKDINDSFGHSIGDELLILVANMLKLLARKSDFVARISGDEFCIVVEDVIHQEDCAIIADKLIKAINKAWHLSNESYIYLSATLGISLYPDNTINAHELLQYSDAALYLAKKEDRGQFRFYNNSLTLQARKNLTLSTQLKEAIIRDQFIVLYQPQIDIKSGKIFGAESLIRWQNGSELVSPKEFITFAEERSLISGISQFVLKQSCKDLDNFLPFADIDFKLSVNISSLELTKLTLINDFKEILQKFNINPINIGIEVTESIFIKDIAQAIECLEEFKNANFMISLDDFGTGYSSLSYLKKLPLDIIKIDKSFIDGVPFENDDVQITKTIISMAKTLGLKVLAEGVETKEQLDFLKNEGCDYYQGYYYSKPISADEFKTLLKKDK